MSDCTTYNCVFTLLPDSVEPAVPNTEIDPPPKITVGPAMRTENKPWLTSGVRVLRHDLNLQNNEFIVFHKANGCHQLCSDARKKNLHRSDFSVERGCTRETPDRCKFWNAHGWRPRRSSCREMARWLYMLQSKEPVQGDRLVTFPMRRYSQVL